MNVTTESAILGIGFMILAYQVFLLRLRDDKILAECKADYKFLHTEINLLRETSAAATESRNLNEIPFSCSGDWCHATKKNFYFPKGVIIGKINKDCDYGKNVLSVDRDGTNCPSGDGSVTFGVKNKATQDYASVTGGLNNTASGSSASVTGGSDNDAMGGHSSVSGGHSSVAFGIDSSVSGGVKNNARNKYTSVSGGDSNHAIGISSSVAGGYYNDASGSIATVSGGNQNKADGNYSTVSGGLRNCKYGSNSFSIDIYKTRCPSGGGSIISAVDNTVTVSDYKPRY